MGTRSGSDLQRPCSPLASSPYWALERPLISMAHFEPAFLHINLLTRNPPDVLQIKTYCACMFPIRVHAGEYTGRRGFSKDVSSPLRTTRFCQSAGWWRMRRVRREQQESRRSQTNANNTTAAVRFATVIAR
jgi:hypothetical protein